MCDEHNTTRFRFWRRLIRLIGVIVPRRLRARFRREWEAELEYREALLSKWDRLDWRSELELFRRSLGAFWDALWLQPRRLEDEVFQDLRFGMRILARSPAFALAAILSLAIGIGANTALFSVVNAVLWRQLPYPHAERLVRVGEWNTRAEFVALSRAQRSFDVLAGWSDRDFILNGGGAPTQLKAMRITPEFLPLLGVTPQAGRAFNAEEFHPGRDQVALISDRLWRGHFGADPRLIGQAVTLDDRRYTVVGVTPPGFDFFPAVDLLTPLALAADDLRQENYYGMGIVARLKPGMRPEMAQRDVNGIARGFEEPREVRIEPLRELLVKDFRLTLLALWGVVGFVLLIACANVANLMLARGSSRQKELAIRAAVGARRTRLVRQLLTESILLAGIGGALGMLCAYLGVHALLAANPAILPQLSRSAEIATIPRLREVVIDWPMMAFNFALTLLTGVFFGLAPALRFSRPAGTARGSRLGLHRGTQSLLVIGEVALALVLLAGAGLLVRSLWRLQQIDPGFQPNRLLTLQLEFPAFRYRGDAQVTSFVAQLGERLAALPDVKSIGAADSLPLSPAGSMGSITIEGKAGLRAKPDDLPPGISPPPPPPGVPASGFFGPSAFFSRVSPSYFSTLGIPLREGREFGPRDGRSSLPVAIVNEEMARRYWPGENPLGKRLRAGGDEWRTVVGVVGNVRRFALEDRPAPEFYMPLLQPRKLREGEAEPSNEPLASYISLVVRTSGQPEDATEAVRHAVWELDREQPILQLGTMQARLAEVFAPRRFNLLLFGLFALIALLLAAVGLYGVLAYMVSQRTHEIGIRMALGAQARDVLWLVVRQGLALTLMGAALGLVAALALTRVLQNLLFGVSPTDPATFVGITLLLIGVASIAGFIPAWRATKVDPLRALRHE